MDVPIQEDTSALELLADAALVDTRTGSVYTHILEQNRSVTLSRLLAVLSAHGTVMDRTIWIHYWDLTLNSKLMRGGWMQVGLLLQWFGFRILKGCYNQEFFLEPILRYYDGRSLVNDPLLVKQYATPSMIQWGLATGFLYRC